MTLQVRQGIKTPPHASAAERAAKACEVPPGVSGVLAWQAAAGNFAVAQALAPQRRTDGPVVQRAIDFGAYDKAFAGARGLDIQDDAERNFFFKVQRFRVHEALFNNPKDDPAKLYDAVTYLFELTVGARTAQSGPHKDVIAEVGEQARQDYVNLTGCEGRSFDEPVGLLRLRTQPPGEVRKRIDAAVRAARDPLQLLNFLRAAYRYRPALLAVIEDLSEKPGAQAPEGDARKRYEEWRAKRVKGREPLYPSAYPKRTGDMPLPTFGGWFSYLITEVAADRQIDYLARVLTPDGVPRPLNTPAQLEVLTGLWNEGMEGLPPVDLAELLTKSPVTEADAAGTLAPDPAPAQDEAGLELRYSYMFRGDTRAPDVLAAQGGTKRRTDVPKIVRGMAMDQPWNPLQEKQRREEVWFRLGKDDNCLVSAVSVARSIVDATKFPLLETLTAREPKPAREAGTDRYVTETTVYLVRVTEGHDTAGRQAKPNPQRAEAKEKYGVGEYAVKQIAAENHLASFKLKRVHFGEDANAGHTCQIVDHRKTAPESVLDQLPAHVRDFIENPPGKLPDYQTDDPIKRGSSEVETRALDQDERERTNAEARRKLRRESAPSKINNALGAGVLIKEPDRVKLVRWNTADDSEPLREWPGIDEVEKAFVNDEGLMPLCEQLITQKRRLDVEKADREAADRLRRRQEEEARRPVVPEEKREAPPPPTEAATSPPPLSTPRKAPAMTVEYTVAFARKVGALESAGSGLKMRGGPELRDESELDEVLALTEAPRKDRLKLRLKLGDDRFQNDELDGLLRDQDLGAKIAKGEACRRAIVAAAKSPKGASVN